jgi:hypothetical protein
MKKRSTRTADCCVSNCAERAKFVTRTFTERVPTHCTSHAQPRVSFFEFNNRLCEDETCSGRASFAAARDQKAVRCGDHKLTSDINVVKKLCECGRVKPTFAPSGTRSAKRCSSCKIEGDVDIRNAKCVRCNERQVAAIVKGHEDEGMKYCLTCAASLGLECMNGRVAYCACGTQSIFDIPGTPVKSARFCGQCRDPSLHVDVRHDSQMCTVCVNTRGSRVIDGKLYCHGCVVKIFPDIPTRRNYKNKERAVEDFLTVRFSGRLTLTFDRKVARVVASASAGAGGIEEEEDDDVDGCESSGRKPDVFIDMGEWVVIVEVDERQHKQNSYKSSCENKRIMQIFDDAGRRPIVFIRFNPDAYKNSEGHRIPSPWTVDGRTGSVEHIPVENRAQWEHRLMTLASAIERATSVRPEAEVSFEYLFFDESD